jgi:hypothetical protein
MHFGGIAQTIENDAGLNGSELCAGIDGTERIHIARKIKDDGDIDALAGERSTRAARKDGGTYGTAGGNGGFDVGGVTRVNNTDGELTVIGGVGCIKRAGTKVEKDIAAKGGLEVRLKLAMRGEALVFELRLMVEDGESAHG